MSTRCQIGIYENKEKEHKDFEVLLYRHSDGYPEGVLPDIIPFLKRWKKQRGISDTEYIGARLLQHLCNEYDGLSKTTLKQLKSKDGFTGVLGHGICKDFHWDIAYFYKIYPNAVEVYKVKFFLPEDNKEAEFKKIKTIKL